MLPPGSPLAALLASWIREDRPTASWASTSPKNVQEIRVGPRELAPTTFSVLRNFIVEDSPRVQRIRMIACSGLGGATREFRLLGGEKSWGDAQYMSTVCFDLDGVEKIVNLPLTCIAQAAVLPADPALEAAQVSELTALYMAIAEELERARLEDRKGLKPTWHHEDDLVSATVVEKDGRWRLRLSFGVDANAAIGVHYTWEAGLVPESLRRHLGPDDLEPEVPMSDPEKLIAIARHLVAGQFKEALRPACEPVCLEHGLRSLFRIPTPAGTLSFVANTAIFLDQSSLPTVLRDLSERGQTSDRASD